MKDGYDRQFKHDSMHEPDRRLQGLSGVGNECPCPSWTLGGSKTRMESSASKDTPSYAFLSTSIEPFFSSLCFFPLFQPTRP